MKLKKVLYLDGAANTPIDKKVFKAMKPYMANKYVGNSFSPHEHGIRSMCAIEDARRTILKSFGYSEESGEKVYFTSGSTEANNWVIQSLCLLLLNMLNLLRWIVTCQEQFYFLKLWLLCLIRLY